MKKRRENTKKRVRESCSTSSIFIPLLPSEPGGVLKAALYSSRTQMRLTRFERATSTSAGLRSNPAELQSQNSTERKGFEPPIRLPVCRFSKPVHSTTLPSLQSDSIMLQNFCLLVKKSNRLNKCSRIIIFEQY